MEVYSLGLIRISVDEANLTSKGKNEYYENVNQFYENMENWLVSQRVIFAKLGIRIESLDLDDGSLTWEVYDVLKRKGSE